jgi:HEAT repeat protein
MGLFKIIRHTRLFIWSLLFLLPFHLVCELSNSQAGKILFLVQQGDHTQALKLYRQYYESQSCHDFELIHRIGLGLLDYGFRQTDPEIQLLSLFGASISAHEEAYYILEESLKSSYPQIQLVALQSLARLQNDQADQAINRAMGSNHLLIRLEAAHQLCKKKHPQAVSQTESLMYKTPKEILSMYPQLYAMVGDVQAIRILRKMLNNPSEKVRVAVILSAAQQGRDDLLPQIRQQASHLNYAQQEASAYALGLLKDEKSIAKLKKLTSSQYPNVALAAQQALYRLGQKDYLPSIRKAAKEGDVFAVAALSEIPEEEATLLELVNHTDIQVRVNATIALLEQHHSVCLTNLREILIQDRRGLAFTQNSSPAGALEAWKVIPSASQVLKEDVSAYVTNIELKESVLEKARELSEPEFLQIADLIFTTRQNTLIPLLVELLEDLGTPEAIQILMKYQQKLGAPLIRQYCNLALYRLKEPGPYGDQLRQWVKSQNQQDLIRFRPFVPWEAGKGSYQLTPEETSRLLIEAFEAFANNQDQEGIEVLIEAIQNGHAKNKYALAGLLLRATH